MNFLLIQNFFWLEAQIVRRNQVIFHPALPSGDGQTVEKEHMVDAVLGMLE